MKRILIIVPEVKGSKTMTNKNDKPYWKESLECYIIICLMMLLFLGVFVVSGELTGTDWIGYLKKLAGEFSMDIFNG